MGIKERKELEKQEMRKLILDTAMKLFLEKGIENITCATSQKRSNTALPQSICISRIRMRSFTLSTGKDLKSFMGGSKKYFRSKTL